MAPKVEIVFGANVQQFAAGVGKVKQQLNNLLPSELQNKLIRMASGVFGVAALRRVLQASADLKDMSDRLRVNIRTMQEWQHAAQETGTSVQSFATAYRTLLQVQADAMEGRNPEAIAAFERMGLTMEGLKAMNPEQVFRAVADQMQRSGDSTEELNSAISLMGRSALDVLPAMRRGLRDLGDDANRLGLILEDDVVTKLADANGQIDRMKRQGMNIVANLLPGPVSGMDFLTTGLLGGGQMAKYYWQRLTGNAEGASATAGAFNRSWQGFEQRSGHYLGIGGMRNERITGEELAARRREIGIEEPFRPYARTTGEMMGPEVPKGFGDPISIAPSVDALTKIGLFRWGGSGVEGRLDRQIDELRQIRSELRELNNQQRQE